VDRSAGVARSFAAIGRNVRIFEPCSFVLPERIVLRDEISISEFGLFHGGSGLDIGNFVHIASHCSVAGGGRCVLEDFTCLAAGVRLVTGSERVDGSGLVGPTVPPELRAVERSFVHLQRHVFLGSNVVVLPGLTLGEGAVVGAGAVVTRDLEPWTVYMGCPAEAVRTRPRETVKRFESLAYEQSGVQPFVPPAANTKDDRLA
jgi:acetyltransferase-like isoleucine patch superfamily enzyme